MHAERVAADPRAVRWVVPPGSLPQGLVRGAPGRLGEMFDGGTLTAGLVEHTAVWLWTAGQQVWASAGAAVQSALREALAEPGSWLIDPDPGEVLHLIANELLDGPDGDFIRSHGGSASVERIGGGDMVAVRLGGACSNCLAADQTLRLRLIDGLRRRCPELVEVDRGEGRLILRLGA